MFNLHTDQTPLSPPPLTYGDVAVAVRPYLIAAVPLLGTITKAAATDQFLAHQCADALVELKNSANRTVALYAKTPQRIYSKALMEAQVTRLFDLTRELVSEHDNAVDVILSGIATPTDR